MDFAWSEQDDELKKRAAEFAGTLGSAREFSREAWAACGDFGLLGSYVPEGEGGLGRSVLQTIHMLVGFGAGCGDNGFSLAVNGQMWAVQEPVLTFGSEYQKQKYLRPMCKGLLAGAHAMTEPDAGSDAFSLKTVAVAQDGGYLLNGKKIFIGLGPVCDVALVFASTNPELGQWGVSAFLVDASSDGFTASPPNKKMGLQGSPAGTIELNNVFVPEQNRLGPEGAGVSIFNHSMEWERSFIFTSHVGAMERQLDACIEFAKSRKQFGQPIGQFQSVSNRIADMRIRLETARLMLYRAAWLKDQDLSSPMDSALTKVHLSEAFLDSSLDSTKIHGGRGYFSEYGIEADLRDATGGVIYSGTNDVQRQLIAKLLGV
ncbi:MAG: acyl-CoA dehydrogenase family protein [Pseudomonadota bacterium]